MTIHKPTLIRVLRSINTSDLDYETRISLIHTILLDAIAHDITVDMEKMIRGSGIKLNR